MNKPRDLVKRTREFALQVIRLYTALPRNAVALVIGRQLLRSGTAVGANYREALRARSKAEYAAKLNLGLMELEESAYWLELLQEGKVSVAHVAEIAELRKEVGELSAIFVTLIKMARKEQARKEAEN